MKSAPRFFLHGWRELQWGRITALSVVGLVGLLTYLTNSSTLPHRIALDGYSPIDWANQLRDLAAFANDFPSGIRMYSRSLFMHVYPLADQWLGVKPEVTIMLVLAVEILCLIIGYAYLCKIFPGTAYPAVVVVVVLLTIASNLATLEMSRIWRPFYAGLFYNVADAARLIAIVMFLTRRWFLAALFCAFAITTHVIIGGLALLCIISMALAAPREYLNRRSVLAFLSCSALSIAWLLIQPPASVTADEIPYKTWHALTRLMNYHWYTLDTGLLTDYAIQTSIPLLVLSALFFNYLPKLDARPIIARAYATGFVVMLGLCLLGIAFSIWLPHPLLIKLNLQRASMLAITLATPVVVAGLIQDLRSASFWIMPVVWVLLIMPFIGLVAIPVGTGLLLLIFHLLYGKPCSKLDPYRIWCLVLTILVATLVMIWAAYVGFDKLYAYRRYLLGEQEIWAVGAGLTLLTVLLRKSAVVKKELLPLLIMVVAGYAGLKWLSLDHQKKSANTIRATAYRDVQDWARLHTQKDTLFFVDPLIMYGWRDYSQRPSFGNVREWLHTGWGYDSNADIYHEGLKRFAEFGLPLDAYLNVPPSEGSKIYSDLDKRQYSMSDDWRIDLAKRYGISYFVLEKTKLPLTALPIAYSNEIYVILDAVIGKSN